MSLKLIISFVIFVVLTVYFTFLNPQDIEIYFTQSRSVTIPISAFMLISVLIGVVLSTLLTGIHRFRQFLKDLGDTRRAKKQERKYQKWDHLFHKAENAAASGHPQKGVALFEKLLSQNPNHLGALNHIGNLCRQEGRFDQAIELHRRAAELDPENIQTLLNLAEDYTAAGLLEKEIHTLARILDLDANSLPTLRMLRDTYLKMKNYEKAYQIQKSILPLIREPAELAVEQELFSHIVYTRGFQAYRQKKYDQAIAEFKRSIRENSQSLPAYITLGDIYLECDNPRAALKTWRSGFEATHSPVCLLRMEKLHERRNKPKDIHKMYEEAIHSGRETEKEIFSRLYANYLLKEGSLQEALTVLEAIEEPSVSSRLLISKACRSLKDIARMEQVNQSLYQEVIESVTRYICRECKISLGEWSAECPACQAWNSLGTGLPDNKI